MRSPSKNAAVWVLMMPSFLVLGLMVWSIKWYWLNVPELRFGWVMLGLCGLFFFEFCSSTPTVKAQAGWHFWLFLGLGVFFIVLFRILQVSIGTTPFGLYVGFGGALLLVIANADYMFGWAAAVRLGVSCAYIYLALPFPSFLHAPLVAGLREGVTRVATEALMVLGVPVMQAGSIIQIGPAQLQVSDACSGIRSLQSTLMFCLVLGRFGLKSAFSKFCLLFLGALTAFCMNSARLVAVGFWTSMRPNRSPEHVHDIVGWLELAGLLLIAVLLLAGLMKLESQAKPGFAGCAESESGTA